MNDTKQNASRPRSHHRTFGRLVFLAVLAVGVLIVYGRPGSSQNEKGKPPAEPKSKPVLDEVQRLLDQLEKGPKEPLLPTPPYLKTGKPEPAANDDEAYLQRSEVKTDTAELVAFLKRRTLTPEEIQNVRTQIDHLASPQFEVRQAANLGLVKRGPSIIPLLQAAASKKLDLETHRRIEECTRQLKTQDYSPGVVDAVIRVLAQRKPKGLGRLLLDFAPFADGENHLDEIRAAYASLIRDKETLDVLTTSLKDADPLRRAIAGEVLARDASGELRGAAMALLNDADAVVRYRTSLGAVAGKQKAGVEILIRSLADIPLSQAWQAEETLMRLAKDTQSPAAALGAAPADRAKCRDAWLVWWKANSEKVDLGLLSQAPKLQGYTTVVLLDNGSVIDLDAENRVRWKIDGLMFPLDVQVIDETRILVAEYHAQRVTERRTSDGQVIWSRTVEGGPLVAQRLANGNTFVATDHSFYEFSKDGKLDFHLPVGGDDDTGKILKAMKLPSGEIAYLRSDAKVVRCDSKGKELASFEVPLSKRLYGGRIYMQPSGRVLVTLHEEDKVAEYDSLGKLIWETNFEKPVAATRLSNGNILVTSMLPAVGAIEINRQGQEVWSYRTGTRVTRALRR